MTVGDEEPIWGALERWLDLPAVQRLLDGLGGDGVALLDRSGKVLAGEVRPSAVERVLRIRHEPIGSLLGDAVPPERLEAVAGVLEQWAGASFELESTVAELVLRYEELALLHEASETISSVMDLQEVTRRILDKAAEMLGVDLASLMLVDPETQTLAVQDVYGLDRSVVEHIRLRVGEELSGWVAREGKPLLIEDIETHPIFARRNEERYLNRSLLSVPLKVKDRVVGVIHVNNKRSGEPFSSGDLKLLSALASLAAVSIENARTYKKAITDRLTRLHNFGYFREELARRLEQVQGTSRPLSLILFDIDHFKCFNDRNGHEVANIALARVAALCTQHCRQRSGRPPDLLARYGGEEFVIVLSDTTTEQACQVAERIRTCIETTAFEGGENQPAGKVTVSLGVATWPHDAIALDSLVHAADRALYRAKQAGRNNVQRARSLEG